MGAYELAIYLLLSTDYYAVSSTCCKNCESSGIKTRVFNGYSWISSKTIRYELSLLEKPNTIRINLM